MRTAPQIAAIPSNVPGIAWPPVRLGNSAPLLALIQLHDRSQWLTTPELEKLQMQRLRHVAEHAQKHSPYFRTRLEKAELTPEQLATPEGLLRLPLLTRQELQTVGPDLLCAEVPEAQLPLNDGRSSGSTGQPVAIKKTGVNRILWHANMMREHIWHKRDFSSKILSVRATMTEPSVQNGWGNPVSTFGPSGQVLSLPVTFSARRILDAMMEFGAKNLVIYPNVLDAMVAICEEENIRYKLDHIWSIGETLKPELRARAVAVFDTAIEDDYSCNELGILALQCPETGLYHVMAESVLVEILDLHNLATPMIRYDIGDYAEKGPACSCGRGLPTIQALKGRKRNLVVKPDGSRHWPPLTKYVFKSGISLGQFQIIQHSLTDIEVTLVNENRLTVEQEAILTEHLLLALDHPFPIRYTYLEKMPQPPNGKFEDFITHVDPHDLSRK